MTHDYLIVVSLVESESTLFEYVSGSFPVASAAHRRSSRPASALTRRPGVLRLRRCSASSQQSVKIDPVDAA